MTTKTILSLAAAFFLTTASAALADGGGSPQHSDRFLPQTSAQALIEGRNVAVVRTPTRASTSRETISTGYSGF